MRKSLIWCERGQSVVEMAVLLPVFVLLLLGIMEGGRIFSSYIELENAARDGARYAAVSCTSMAVRDDEIPAWVVSTLTPYLESRLSTLLSENLQVSFSRTANVGLNEVWVELNVGYPLEITTPLISTLTGNPLNIRSRMVMKGE